MNGGFLPYIMQLTFSFELFRARSVPNLDASAFRCHIYSFGDFLWICEMFISWIFRDWHL